MTLATYMAALATVPSTGERVGRQMVLAVDCSTTGDASVGDYLVVAYHVENHGASLSANTTDKSYIGEGDSTIKTGTKRSFDITGQRLVGEGFQDFCLGHDIKFGVGTTVQRDYVYFDAGTSEGESGTATITVTKDGTGAAGEPTDVEITLSVNGTPAEYTWAAPSPAPAGGTEGGTEGGE